MQNNKEHIFLLVQSGYSARNFVLSGFLKENKTKVTFWSDQDYIEQYNIPNKLVKLPKYSYNGKINFLQKIKNKAEIFFNIKKFKNKSYSYYLIGIKKNKKFKTKVKDKLISFLALFFSNEKGIQYLDKPFYKLTRNTTYYKKCKEQLIAHKPSILFCTHQRASNAVAPVLAARDLGIKTVCFIHSWDNVPKGVQLVKADTYFVWSDYMKKEMLAYYPFIKSNAINITGTPQFIPYFKDEYRLKREDFLSEFKIDSSKRLILFTGNDKTTSPNDPIYLSHICESVIELNKNYDNYRVVFRPNPIDRNKDFDTVLSNYSDIVTELKPDWFGSDVFLWNKGGPSKKDITLLVNSILHSDLVINMGSTMALDAALLNKPACYINYDVPSNYNWSVKRTYKFIHFDMIKKINPVFWINSKKEIQDVIKTALIEDDEKKLDRELWIKSITELPVEETNKRMWHFLLEQNEV